MASGVWMPPGERARTHEPEPAGRAEPQPSLRTGEPAPASPASTLRCSMELHGAAACVPHTPERITRRSKPHLQQRNGGETEAHGNGAIDCVSTVGHQARLMKQVRSTSRLRSGWPGRQQQAGVRTTKPTQPTAPAEQVLTAGDDATQTPARSPAGTQQAEVGRPSDSQAGSSAMARQGQAGPGHRQRGWGWAAAGAPGDCPPSQQITGQQAKSPSTAATHQVVSTVCHHTHWALSTFHRQRPPGGRRAAGGRSGLPRRGRGAG